MLQPGPIGIFDSGYGGLTVFREITRELPDYDYIYFGDNARAPYGPRSFEVIYHYTLECVRHLFGMGCNLIVLACNTASAKALRSIQQQDLEREFGPERRVLGVIRPTTELVGSLTKTRQVGIFATYGTVESQSYVLEINKFFPEIAVWQEACPMWVPLIENGEQDSAGADYFVKKHVDALLGRCPEIDTIILGCTHYPLLSRKIREYVPANIQLISQGDIVAHSLADYLRRHPNLEAACSRGGQRTFYTTETPAVFEAKARHFYRQDVQAQHLEL